MRILFLAPRLDVPFKNLGPVPNERGPIEPIRQHWARFIDQWCALYNNSDNDTVIRIERPLWQFTPKETETIVRTHNIDRVFVPHREAWSFPIENAETFYYMQTVFPWRFYVDPLGYAGGSTMMDTDFSQGDENSGWFDNLRTYALSGRSKFAQPSQGRWKGPGEYAVFTCQLPHDHTILHHSKVSVEEALYQTCEETKKAGLILVIKGHPINPAAMAPLKGICYKYTHTLWIDNASIHDVLSQAHSVVTVNSGTGMEALLHKKPVATFGRAEYNCVAYDANQGLQKFFVNPQFNEVAVKKFFDIWCNMTYDTNLT